MDRVVALNGYLNVARGFSIDPGQFDCALFVAGWVDTVRGTAFMERWIGRYRTLPEGRALLKAEGIRSLRDLADRELTSVGGWVFAQPGDVALVKDRSLCFGIVGSGGIIHVVSPVSGLDVVPMDRAWEVYRP
jgi:hypothetical protein